MKLYYGNLNADQKKDASVNNVFTKYFKEFTNNPPPNFAESTEEVQQLIELMNNIKKDNDFDEILDFTELFDIFFIEQGIPLIYERIGISPNTEDKEYLHQISKDIGALIMRLKEYYNRARPYQVATYSKQNLFPLPTFSGHSPAYPSGHASQSLMMCKVLSFKYPSKKEELEKIAKEIAFSRLVLGCHYPSDNKFGEYIVNQLCQKQDIKDIYFT